MRGMRGMKKRESSVRVSLKNKLILKNMLHPNETMDNRIGTLIRFYRSKGTEDFNGPFWYEQYQKMREQVLELITQIENIRTLGVQTSL